MIPTVELRRIIEASFTPMTCHCTINPGGNLTVEVTDPQTGQVDLLVMGIPTESLNTSRDINDLIAQLREELKANQEWFAADFHGRNLLQRRHH
ncbi:DUF1652 domain-containing protein [Pseudomonas sp. HR96]|uniref:DUF1652 domain-containing protein n=1 Tax=Pseudomonas sp. HR96 TaxID=1027966 RepID=UPI002A75B48B|nr:DUF1652 domain-containing protein [Pseudomonas sp. HR96]WPO98173.1 DUF1652 domain-containing protein [Pseudomonas sp. HR96]